LFLAILAVVLASPALALDVRMTGVADEDLNAELKASSLLFEQSGAEEDGSEEASAQEILSTARADYKRLLATLYDNGFFAATIGIKLDGREAASISPVGAPKRYSQAVITIEPGKPFRFGQATIAPVAPGTELPEGFAIGETAGLLILKETVSAGVEAWRDAGHAKAALADQKLTARHGNQTINAELTLDPGPRLTFGPLTVKGNKTVDTTRIMEIAGLPTGTVYSPAELDKAQKRLRRTGTFSSVAMIEADAGGPDDALGITAQVVEAAPRRFGFGAEVSSSEGVTVSTFWLHRNILGGAERLRLQAEVGGIGGDTGGEDGLLRARFQRPATFGADTDFYALIEAEQEDEIGFFSRQATIEAGIERFATDERTYRAGVALRRGLTRDAFGENNYTLLMLPLGGTFDYRDDILDARKGFYADAEIAPFYAISGADNGALSYLDLRGYKTFGTEKPVTFAVRGQLGSVVGPDLDVAPADFLFYSGGGGTVRGHDYQSLGVTLDNGAFTGGRSFMGLSAEVRVRTAGNLGYVGFFDAGYIGAESFPDGSGEWQSGAGFGIRYATPIGPIRFDVAVPTTGDDDGNNFQVYIGIGQAF
jgi:translocation and assembly module TamA